MSRSVERKISVMQGRIDILSRDVGRLLRLVSLNRQFIQEMMNFDNTNYPANVVGSHARIAITGESSGVLNNNALAFPIPTLDEIEANLIRTQLVPGAV